MQDQAELGKVFRLRLLLAFAVPFLALLGLTTLAFMTLTEAGRAARSLLDRGTGPQTLTSDLRGDILLLDRLAALHVAATSAPEMARLEDQITEAAQDFDHKLELLAEVTTGPATDLLDRLRNQTTEAGQVLTQVLTLSRQKTNTRAAVLSTMEMPATRARVLTALEALGNRESILPQTAAIATEANGIVAAEKNALLNPEAGFIAQQLAAVGQGRTRIAAALDQLAQALTPEALSGLQGGLHDFLALDDKITALVRANSATRAADLLRGPFADQQAQRMDVLAGYATFAQTSLAHAANAAKASLGTARWRLGLAALVALGLTAALARMMAAALARGLAEGAAQARGAGQGRRAAGLSPRLVAALTELQDRCTALEEGAAALRPALEDATTDAACLVRDAEGLLAQVDGLSRGTEARAAGAEAERGLTAALRDLAVTADHLGVAALAGARDDGAPAIALVALDLRRLASRSLAAADQAAARLDQAEAQGRGQIHRLTEIAEALRQHGLMALRCQTALTFAGAQLDALADAPERAPPANDATTYRRSA